MLGQAVEFAAVLQAGEVVFALERPITGDERVQLVEEALLGVAGRRLILHQDHVRRVTTSDRRLYFGEVIGGDVLRRDSNGWSGSCELLGDLLPDGFLLHRAKERKTHGPPGLRCARQARAAGAASGPAPATSGEQPAERRPGRARHHGPTRAAHGANPRSEPR